ncbi:MAG: HlyD family efflux transporter periplasmic adaptor subunit [Planctomycetia bacterium]|jgi:multidrug resistance efflux pump
MYIPRIGIIAILLLATACASLSAETIPIERCYIELIEEADIAAQESGILIDLKVTDGQTVNAGDILAKVDSELAILQRNVAQAELNVAQKESKNYISVEYAKATAEMARREVQRIREANARMPGAVAQTDVDKADLALTEADTYIKKAGFDLEIKQEEVKVKMASLKAAEEHIKRREVRAPWPPSWKGVVQRIIRHRGDWVEPGTPILHLVRMDKVRVQCLIDGDLYRQEDVVGQQVLVTVTLPRQKDPLTFEGFVTGSSPTVQADNHFKVWADIDNKTSNGFWILRKGMTCEMNIQVRPQR